MAELEKVIRGLECQYKPRMTCYGCGYFIDRDKLCNKNKIFREAVDLLKSQERKISRLKNHMDCEAAETTPEGCVGYGRGFNDDEPCETCKQSPAYIGYGEE
jgi:hypothetical protein